MKTHNFYSFLFLISIAISASAFSIDLLGIAPEGIANQYSLICSSFFVNRHRFLCSFIMVILASLLPLSYLIDQMKSTTKRMLSNARTVRRNSRESSWMMSSAIALMGLMNRVCCQCSFFLCYLVGLSKRLHLYAYWCVGWGFLFDGWCLFWLFRLWLQFILRFWANREGKKESTESYD